MRNVLPILLAVAATASPAFGEQGDLVRAELTEVVARPLEKTAAVPGELQPYQRVEIHAKVTGFVEAVHVDRGSFVERGQALAVLSAPELQAKLAEAQARISAVVAQRQEAEADLAAAESTYQRLAEAAKTPGVVAGNEVVLAEHAVEAERARIASLDQMIAAYEAAARAVEQMEAYLTVTAPFVGVITERRAHVGALAGPAGEAALPLFTLEQINRLRLVAAIPEAYRQSVSPGRRVQFTVPAFPGEPFTGVVARPAYAVDPKTRTMPVELDVSNPRNRLTPGMYAEVQWPVRRGGESLFVPRSAIKATTERIFVIRIRNGAAEWVDVRRGLSQDQMAEVFGELEAGDRIVLRATDEIRPGMRVEPGP